MRKEDSRAIIIAKGRPVISIVKLLLLLLLPLLLRLCARADIILKLLGLTSYIPVPR